MGIPPDGFPGGLWLLWTNSGDFHSDILFTNKFFNCQIKENKTHFLVRYLNPWLSKTLSTKKPLDTISRLDYVEKNSMGDDGGYNRNNKP